MDSSIDHEGDKSIRGMRRHLGRFLEARLEAGSGSNPHRRFFRLRGWRLLLVVLVLALGLPNLLGITSRSGSSSAPATSSQAVVTATPETTQEGPPSESSRGAGGPQTATVPADDCGITNIQACLSDFINSFLTSIAEWWKTQVNNVTALGFVFFTPPSVSYDAPIVQQIQAYSLTVVASVLALVFAIAGYNYMAGRSITWTEILPQIFFCGMMAWGIQALLIFAVDGSNDFILGLQGVNLQNLLSNNTDTSTMGLITYIFELVLDLALALESLARLALLDVLLALAPIGVFCFALPQTRTWGRLWAEGFVATLLIQPIQAVIVLIGSSFMSNLTELFGPNFPPIVQILLGMACVYLATRVPAMLGRFTHMAGDLRGQVTRVAMMLASGA
jgi:hypothetical protein